MSNLRLAGAEDVAVDTLDGVGDADVVGAEEGVVEAKGLEAAGRVPKVLAGAGFVGGGVDDDPFT